MVLETGLTAFIIGLRTSLMNEFFLNLTSLGSLTIAMILVAGIYFISKNRSFQLLTGILATSISFYGLKVLFSFPRPPAETMIANVSTASFPSGHTALAFTIAVMLSDWRPELKNYLYSLAVLIGFSRIYLGAHFLVDVLAGALLGYLIGRVVLSDKLDKLD